LRASRGSRGEHPYIYFGRNPDASLLTRTPLFSYF
jgi:hypothetical protein